MVMVTRQYGMLASEIASSEAFSCPVTCHLPFTGTNHGHAGQVGKVSSIKRVKNGEHATPVVKHFSIRPDGEGLLGA